MKKNFINIFGKKLTSLRENSGLDQGQLADEIGVSRQTVNTWEGKSVTKLTYDKAEKLSKVLGVTIEVLTSDKINDSYSSFRHQIFEGDYVGLHKRAWDQYEETLTQARKLLEKIVENNTTLVNANADLASTVARLSATRKQH